ncbi:MAG TPA: 30S ribosomal protein S20 [Candidatus Woesebacteria bacterium]|nr:30S ribosomal protein S20 [Candidatus Woesebacteria bacterium]
MPNIKSAKKKDNQDKKRTTKNRIYAKQIEDIMNKAQKGVTGSKKGNIISEAYKKIDKAATKAVIHPNKAARLKSKVTRLLAK